MLIELRIRDFAVIHDLSLELREGLNALSGETGAGKSIVVGALSLLLGERANSDVVRGDAGRALVEGVFDVSTNDVVLEHLRELGIEPEEGLLILKREVAREGRNRAWANGSSVTVGVVGKLGRILVDLHGQHDHQALLRPSAQRDILDQFAGVRDTARLVREHHKRAQLLVGQFESAEESRRELEAHSDFIRFQLKEIEGASLEAGEDEALTHATRRLTNSEELVREASRLQGTLHGEEDSVCDRLSEAASTLARLARLDPSLEAELAAVDEAYHAISEAGQRLASYAEGVEHDPGRLEEIRERLDQISRLKRKYGPELRDVLLTGERLSAQLHELHQAETSLEGLRGELADEREALNTQANRLSIGRREGAQRLEGEVSSILPSLGLPDGELGVALEPLPEIGSSGAERVEFRIALNRGFDSRPLARVASGGELSRIMLALKTVLAGVDQVPTMVFDEIDAGIGGSVATQVAQKLQHVSRRHQVFVVTHLAQLASRASVHLLVEKTDASGIAETQVTELDGEARVVEIARMLGGDPESATSREHARELLRV